MFISAGYNPKLEKAFSKFYQSSFLLMLIQCWIENFSGPCFVFGPVFSLYLERVTGVCTSFAYCFDLCVYLFI